MKQGKAKERRDRTSMRNKKNRTIQMIVLIVLILLLMILSICIGIYAAEGGEDENVTRVSENMKWISEEDTEINIEEELDTTDDVLQVPETESVAEDEEDMTQMSENIEPQEYFTQSVITDEIYARINGCSYVENEEIALEDLRYLQVLYVGFDAEEHVGELIVNKAIANDILEIMRVLYENQYPIERMELVDEYGGDDELSMQANNTSAFNYRPVEGTNKLSRHSYGMAIDINPFYNPCVRKYSDGSSKSFPEGSDEYVDRSKDFPYKIDKEDLCYQLFTEHGFRWGGTWNNPQDYQHFDKEPNK